MADLFDRPGEGTLFDTSDRLPDRTAVRPIGEGELVGPAPSFGEVFEASRAVNHADRTDFETLMLHDGYAPIVEALGLGESQNPALFGHSDGGHIDMRRSSELLRRQGRDFLGSMADRATQEQAIADAIRDLRAKNPKALPGVPDTVAGLRAYFLDQEKKKRAPAQAVLGRAEGVSGTIASLGGALRETATDPFTLGTLPVGGAGGTIGKIFMREFLVNSLLEAAVQPVIGENRDMLGEELTGGEALANIAAAGLFGGALEAGGTAAARAIAPHLKPLADAVNEIRIARGIATADIPGTTNVTLTDLFHDVGDQDLVAAFRAAVPDEAMTPDERAAINVITRESEIGESSPFEASPEGDAEHQQSLAEAINALSENRPPQPSAAGAASLSGGSTGRAAAATSTGQSRPRSVPVGIPSDIVQGLLAEGIPEHVARGAAAGAVAESRANANAVNPTSGAFGIGQWLGTRKAELFRRYGPSPTRAQQIKFLAWELKGGDAGGAKVLAAGDEVAALNSYIRDFMRPAAGRETDGDLERGMAALGRGGEDLPAMLAAGEVEIDPAIARLRDESHALEEAVLAAPGGQAGGPPLYRSTMRAGGIGVDAARFQFKGGADDAGVLDTLRGVDKWDPWSANPLIVWEDAQGARWLADGHQRHGLASRLEAGGHEPIDLPVNIMREADGVSAEDARVYAALVNIRQGSGSAVDAAKVFKVAPETLEAALPPHSALVRHAKGLARLSDPAFGAVVNGHVAPDHAAAIGRLLPDNPELHEAMVKVLVDTDPSNAAQAESMIRQAIAAGFHESEQIGLFGEEMLTTSLFKERAKVLDKALARLRRMKLVHRTAAEEADALERAGSTIDRDASKGEAQANAEAIEIVNRLAFSAGPVADALNAASAKFAGGGSLARAVGEFVDAVRAVDLRALGDADRANAGDGGSPGDGGSARDIGDESPSLFDEPAERAALDRPGDGLGERPTLSELEAATERFSDPDGVAVHQQADSLVHDFRADIEAAKPAPEFVGTVPANGIVPALGGPDGKIYLGPPGGSHISVIEAHPEADLFNAKSTGFVTADGQYLDRTAALTWLDEQEGVKIRPSENMRGELDALDYRDQVRGTPNEPKLPPHISDQVAEVLEAMGFERGTNEFSLRLEGVADAGTVSDGARVVTVQMDETGRYLERLDGFDVAKDVDLREFADNPQGAIEAVLDGLAGTYLAAINHRVAPSQRVITPSSRKAQKIYTDLTGNPISLTEVQRLGWALEQGASPESAARITKAFFDAGGELDFDAEIAAAKAAEPTFRMSEEGGEISRADLLKELDDDEAAIAAIKGCL